MRRGGRRIPAGISATSCRSDKICVGGAQNGITGRLRGLQGLPAADDDAK